MKIREHVPLTAYNTFGVRARARYFAEIEHTDEIRQIISDKYFNRIPKLPLGGGSNMLFTGDYNGLVLKINIRAFQDKPHSKKSRVSVRAGAGENWHQLVQRCIEKNYGGIENLSLIPGQAGAAPIQNIGAYGVELKDVLDTVEAVHLQTGEKLFFDKTSCKFGYRDSIFKNKLKGQCIITAITLLLHTHPVLNTSYGAIEQELEKMQIAYPGIREVSRAVCRIRMSKLPDPSLLGNAGSFFKNPIIPNTKYNELKKKYPDMVGYQQEGGNTKIAAGWLIDKAGWKGYKNKRCGVHAQQALVLVNYGKASGRDILELSNKIKKDIMNKFGIALQTEVNII